MVYLDGCNGCAILIFFTLNIWCSVEAARLSRNGKVCLGTWEGMNQNELSNRPENVDRLRSLYTNCSVVETNLELTYIPKDADLSFLEDIEEVQGYVLIASVATMRIPLTSLRIIWGEKAYRPIATHENGTRITNQPSAALRVVSNPGLLELDLSSLREVVRYDVVILGNPYLCYVQTIDWYQILGKKYQNGHLHTAHNFEKCVEAPKLSCEGCVGNPQRCWGRSPGQCQKIYRDKCAPQCAEGTCFRQDLNPTSCCHQACSGGCWGPNDTDCVACKGYWLDGKCVTDCPKFVSYDSAQQQMMPNKNGRYTYLRECVKECPEHMMIEKVAGACVKSCGSNYMENEITRICEPCPSDNCQITRCSMTGRSLKSNELRTWENCTDIDGDLVILETIFKNISDFRENEGFVEMEKATADELRWNLRNIRRVTGYVHIQMLTNGSDGIHPPKSLDFLPNLAVIEGRRLISNFSLFITWTPFQWLDLKSLKTIKMGAVRLTNNWNLCYVNNLPWQELEQDPVSRMRNKVVLNMTKCVQSQKTCDILCDPSKGCFGPGSRNCYECNNWRLGEDCVFTCGEDEGLYIHDNKSKQCAKCDENCLSCKGPGPTACNKCKYAMDGDKCVSKCPDGKYLNRYGLCQSCSPNCAAGKCSGPENFVGRDGCNSCDFGVMLENDEIMCLPDLSESRRCESYPNLTNYFMALPSETKISKITRRICRQCDALCSRCNAIGRSNVVHSCHCKYAFNQRTQECVAECPENTYVDDTAPGQFKLCAPCHPECSSCRGPSDWECLECKHERMFLVNASDDREIEKFRCVKNCSVNKLFPDAEMVCDTFDIAAATKNKEKRMFIAGILGGAFLFLMLLALIAFVFKKRAYINSFRWDKEFPMPPIDPNPDAKPNMARILTISENSIRKGAVLGYGAFGTVYKGVLMPEDKKFKVPIAIKILQDIAGNSQEDMCAEAGNMASMNHTHLVRLIGVCMSQPMMLITPFMPLGNLLDYVQKNRDRIDSERMLKWSFQIASGMAYLEDNRMVHRDLAARNVLVQKPNLVKISDFGLAKMLDIGEEEYVQNDGKMPIKWLALECVQHRRFTHKSDTWAYGVTVWEIITFGEKPYKDVKPNELVQFLVRGERLPQPKSCSLDLWMLLIRCWMLDANSRPSFTQLKLEMENMHKDPWRYITLENDALSRNPRTVGSSEEWLDVNQNHVKTEQSVDEDSHGDMILLNDPSFSGLDDCPGMAGRSWLQGDLYLDEIDVRLGQPGTSEMGGDIAVNNNGCNQQRPRRHQLPSGSGSRRYFPDPIKLHNGVRVKPCPATDMENYLVPNTSLCGDSIGDSSAGTLSAAPGKDDSFQPILYTDVVGTPNPYDTNPGYYNDPGRAGAPSATASPSSARIIEGIHGKFGDHYGHPSARPRSSLDKSHNHGPAPFSMPSGLDNLEYLQADSVATNNRRAVPNAQVASLTDWDRDGYVVHNNGDVDENVDVIGSCQGVIVSEGIDCVQANAALSHTTKDRQKAAEYIQSETVV